ncbi:MAG: ubiquinone/menaquinone biosynthesis methyltransferase [Deltaproteobacteria bacterium]|nr:ubiquinone/menaquinone biosynthesis methyltransferase [Deltaproteobacteria bacterium]
MALAQQLPPPEEKAAVVEAMFDRIAPHYDRMNRLFTFRLDQRWRRLLLQRARVGHSDIIVDLGCGTGDLCELAAAAGARVVGLDFAARMLAAARARLSDAPLVRADAAALPLATASATVVSSAFALRNFVSIPGVLAEAARVLVRGGRLALLEVDEPTGRWQRWGHAVYFRRIVPLLGALLAERAAYAYLPRSTAYLPPERALLELVTRAGFERVAKHRLSLGIAQLIIAERS